MVFVLVDALCCGNLQAHLKRTLGFAGGCAPGEFDRQAIVERDEFGNVEFSSLLGNQ